MSLEFNRRMHKLLVGSWYKLFKQMDDDGSGKITFDELLDMVRYPYNTPTLALPYPYPTPTLPLTPTFDELLDMVRTLT